MTESSDPTKLRDQANIANLMGIIVYLVPCAFVATAVGYAVVFGFEKSSPTPSTSAMFLALAVSVVYLAFVGGARWGVTTCRNGAPSVLHLAAGIVSWAAGGVVVYNLAKLANDDNVQGSTTIVDAQMSLIIVALAFVPLLVLDGLVVFGRNGKGNEHPELRFLGSAVTLIALVVALVLFWPYW